MDPDEALQLARAARQQWQSAKTPFLMRSAGDMLSEAFAALDEWLSHGGFLPKDWSPPSTPLPSERARGRA